MKDHKSISKFVTNHKRYYNGPWEYTQSPTCFSTTSVPSLHHIITTSIINTNPNPTEPSNHNSMSSRHANSFSNIRIDLLANILVTSATSHLLMSPLKTEASANTVNAQEKKAKGRTLIKRLCKPKEGKHSSNYIHHATNPNPRVGITRACSGHVTSSSNIRIDSM